MPNENRPLAGLKIGISISESEDLNERGFTSKDVTHITTELCKRIVSLGGAVVLGHQWRPQGIMDSIARFAKVYRGEWPTPELPIIYNFLARPDKAALSDQDRRSLAKIIRIYDDIPGERQDRRSNLIAMRRQMSQIVDARICLGGRMNQKPGSVHGVLEEAAIDLQASHPVYISGLLGGTSAVLSGMIGDTRLGYEAALAILNKNGREPVALRDYLTQIASLKSEDLASTCGLSTHMLDRLFKAKNLETVVKYVIFGLQASFLNR